MVEDGGSDPRVPVRLDEGHHIGDGGLPAVFENPGLPAHVHRLADDNDAAGRRAERQVATLFGVSMLATLAFIEETQSQTNQGGMNLGNLGPVSEGMFIWIFGLGIMVGIAVWLGSKAA